MLFAIFFGAGNLIFPAQLGFQSGEYFSAAVFGFIITGVGLPLIGIIAGASSDDGFTNFLQRVFPGFALIMLVTIYLVIGPLFAIPRTAAVSYEIGIVPFNEYLLPLFDPIMRQWFPTASPEEIQSYSTSTLMFIFTLLFFAFTLFCSINPLRIVHYVGNILTPLLLLFIAALLVTCFFIFDNAPQPAHREFVETAPILKGFTSGYLTMDTIASVAFTVVVINSIKHLGISDRGALFKNAIGAAVIAGVLLGLIYLGIGWIGNHFPIDDHIQQLVASNSQIGPYILSASSKYAFHQAGQVILSVIVLLACLTTSIGLVVSIGNYFQETFPILSYRNYAIGFTLISFILANRGLSAVIGGSVPILMIIYPVTIVVIALILFDYFYRLSPLTIRTTVLLTLAISVISVLEPQWIDFLPGTKDNFAWFMPAIVAFLLTLGITLIRRSPRVR